MASIAFGSDKFPHDLLLRRESVDIARVMGHEVLVAFAASHVHSNNGLQPRDGIAQLPFTD